MSNQQSSRQPSESNQPNSQADQANDLASDQAGDNLTWEQAFADATLVRPTPEEAQAFLAEVFQPDSEWILADHLRPREEPPQEQQDQQQDRAQGRDRTSESTDAPAEEHPLLQAQALRAGRWKVFYEAATNRKERNFTKAAEALELAIAAAAESVGLGGRLRGINLSQATARRTATFIADNPAAFERWSLSFQQRVFFPEPDAEEEETDAVILENQRFWRSVNKQLSEVAEDRGEPIVFRDQASARRFLQ